MLKKIAFTIPISILICATMLYFMILYTINIIINIELVSLQGAYSNYTALHLVPNDRNTLDTVNQYLIDNYSDTYYGYYSDTGLTECEVNDYCSQAFLVNPYSLATFSETIIEGALFDYNKDDTELIPVLVGGNYYKNIPINTQIDLFFKESNITIKAIIKGRINTPIALEDNRIEDFSDIYRQRESIIIIPDYLISDLIEDYDKSVWLVFKRNISLTEYNQIHAYLYDKGSPNYEQVILRHQIYPSLSRFNNMKGFSFTGYILLVLTVAVIIILLITKYSSSIQFVITAIFVNALNIPLLILMKNIFTGLLFSSWQIQLSIVSYIMCNALLLIPSIIVLIKARKENIIKESAYEKI